MVSTFAAAVVVPLIHSVPILAVICVLCIALSSFHGTGSLWFWNLAVWSSYILIAVAPVSSWIVARCTAFSMITTWATLASFGAWFLTCLPNVAVSAVATEVDAVIVLWVSWITGALVFARVDITGIHIGAVLSTVNFWASAVVVPFAGLILVVILVVVTASWIVLAWIV